MPKSQSQAHKTHMTRLKIELTFMFDVSASFDYAFDKTIFKNKYELPAKESLYDILGVWESQTTL